MNTYFFFLSSCTNMDIKAIIESLVPTFFVKFLIYIIYTHQPSDEWYWSLPLQYISYIMLSSIIAFILCVKMRPKIAANIAFYYDIMCTVNMIEYVLSIAMMEIIIISHFSRNVDPEKIKITQFISQSLPIIPLIFSVFEMIAFFVFLRKYYLFTESEKGLCYD